MINPKVGDIYILQPQLNPTQDGVWKKDHIEFNIKGYPGRICADPSVTFNADPYAMVGTRPVVKMLDGPSKGHRWVVHLEWLSDVKVSCTCSLDTILLRGCRYKHLHV